MFTWVQQKYNTETSRGYAYKNNLKWNLYNNNNI